MGTLAWTLWLALLVTIPATSFPLVQATIGGETVSPLSLIPLTVLIGLWLIPQIFRRGQLPAETLPLLAFVAIGLASTLLSVYLPLLPYKGQGVVTRGIRALTTVAIGFGYFVSAGLLSRTERQLRASLKAIDVGAVIMLAWGSVQAAVSLAGLEPVPWQLNAIHRWFSVRDIVPDRVSGLAYEPSWFGNQLVVLYLPLWIARAIHGPGVGRRERWLNLGLVAWATGLLVVSRSRLSILALVGIGMLLVLFGLWRASGRPGKGAGTGKLATVRRAGVTGLGAGLILAVVALGLRLLAVHEPRLEGIVGIDKQLKGIGEEYPFDLGYAVADRLAFAERVVYWEAGLEGFRRYPLLGVGLGNAGLLFEQGLPAFGFRLTEIRQALDPTNLNLPNPKSLWVRLLAETGVAGFTAFLTWLIVLGAAGVALTRAGTKSHRAIGLAGVLAIGAQFAEGFSLDTFALPQLWIIMGLVSGQAASLLTRSSPELGMGTAVQVAAES